MYTLDSCADQCNPLTPLALPFVGKIRDPLHNTILYTHMEKTLIDSAAFQRLRRIRQTAFMEYVFPGATHTRFEHSLGAMHVSWLLIQALVTNQSRILRGLQEALTAMEPHAQQSWMIKGGATLLATYTALETLSSQPYLLQCLRLAALLHDCGHTPLSHSGERFLPAWEELLKQLDDLPYPSWLKEGLLRKSKSVLPTALVKHEVYSLFIVSTLFVQNPNLPQGMSRDVCAILDPCIQVGSDSPLAQTGLVSLFHELVSGEVDCDRMDYLLRDSARCGVVYGQYDLARLLDSLCFYQAPQTQSFHLAIRKSGVPAFDDYLRARLSMYQQVYFHKTATACEAMLQYIRQHAPATFPLDLTEYLKLDDHTVLHFLQSKAHQAATPGVIPQLLEDLLTKRRLWKRVYEESVSSRVESSEEHCTALSAQLAQWGVPHEVVESKTYLTTFLPGRRPSSPLQVILKDTQRLRYLEPVEQHSLLVHSVGEETLVRRIFMSPYDEGFQMCDVQKIQRMLGFQNN